MKDLWRKLRGGQQPQKQEAASQFPPDTDAEFIRKLIFYERLMSLAHYPVDLPETPPRPR